MTFIVLAIVALVTYRNTASTKMRGGIHVMSKTRTSGTKAKKQSWILSIFFIILSFICAASISSPWTSFRGEKCSYVTTFFPKTYTINNYVKLFTDTSILNFPKMFQNTFIIAIFTCIISTILYFQYLIQCQECVLTWESSLWMSQWSGLFPSFYVHDRCLLSFCCLGLAEGSMIRIALIVVFSAGSGVERQAAKVSLTRSRRRWTRLRSSMGQQDGRYLPKLPRHSV